MIIKLFIALVFLPFQLSVSATLEESFKELEFLPIQERLKSSINNLNSKEQLVTAQLLLSAASVNNENIGFELLNKLTVKDVPCIGFYRAEWGLRKNRLDYALKEIDGFLTTLPKMCESQKDTLFTCCPVSKYRNATGLRELIKNHMKVSNRDDLDFSMNVIKKAQQSDVPLVKYKNLVFLVDTGAEQHTWNAKCSKELKLEQHESAQYGGSDSSGSLLVANYAFPRVGLFGLTPEKFAGFSFDLSSSEKTYSFLIAKKERFCGIISPQRLIPSGLMVFDRIKHSIKYCQGETCRKKIDLSGNCPMYQFNGRPYFNARVDNDKEKLFLVDTGATMTSANLNYFQAAPSLKTIESKAVGAAGSGHNTQVMEKAVFEFCSIKFNSQPFPVRPDDRNWEWNENGKIGMDLLSSSLVMLDFGNGMALIK